MSAHLHGCRAPASPCSHPGWRAHAGEAGAPRRATPHLRRTLAGPPLSGEFRGMELSIFARFHARSGHEGAVEAALLDVLGPTSEEPGCLGIHAFRSVRDPQLF